MNRPIGMATPTVEELEAEIERLQKQHDNFLQEFWKTNAENERLRNREKQLMGDVNDLVCELKDRPGYTMRENRLRAELERIAESGNANAWAAGVAREALNYESNS